ncbi:MULTISPECIES: nucleotide exchange factor GrpE [unclassified Motilimonas]|uniref:nucleotide exchange factor GrpE n=1 Tax=unclassified Motilimonas TaxID=2643697 RepID=UPI001E488F19|nr:MULTISPECIES: nucleotide exchange factor GrpE [unclassified Motilimonas]MCE0558714.1 nucleotide exchange factor GrpE [Motilimonas sp. E26]MDO6525377.1 nucleotide exchange factor GrpE [Motilimonas sp. 1_MG-2023]
MSSEDKNLSPEEQAVDVEQVAQEGEVLAADAADAVEGEFETGEDARIAELEKKLAAAEEKIAEQKDSVVRAAAEVQNIRSRTAKDVEKAHKFALDKFAAELLPVIDNMELALSHADHENDDLKPMIEGVELTLKAMLSSVEKFGVVAIDPKDAPFDPEKHQAMSMQEIPGVPANTVIAVMQKGYELNGRVIRPAMVMVSKGAAAPSSVDTQA